MKKLAIVGAGAIGGVMGGYITKGGEDITLIDAWREHVEVMRQTGLRITGARGEHLIKVKALHIDEVSQLEGKIDILFIAVKSYDTEKMLNIMKPYLDKDTWVVSCQNGINEDVIIPIVGRANTIGCVVTFGSTLWEAGHVDESGKTGIGFTVGELDGQITPRLKEIARITSLCHETKLTTNIWGERWAKLANNSVDNALTAITGLKTGELLQHEKARHLMARIALEIIQVAEALGYKLEKVVGISSELWKKSAQAWQPEIDDILLQRSVEFASYWPSTFQDAIKGRPLETAHLNGYVVKRGREAGIPTPVNEKIVSLAKELESGRLKPGLDNIDSLLK